MKPPGLGMHVLSAFLVGGAAASAATVESCPGYKATNVVTNGSKLSADLVLAGTACNVYGPDVQKLKLEVQYETETRLHLKISDPAHDRYEVPESVFPRPKVTSGISPSKSAIKFTYTSSPFSFKVIRTKGNEVLFSTGKHPLVFEPQYLRLATDLPQNPNIYGLGEHTDTFRLPTDNFTRTMWSRDAGGVPNGTNLYGNHPVYFEHRTSGTHGVLLLSSNGMDIKINSNSSANSSTLEYNILGGVLDLYFLAGSPTSPTAVATQYASLAGLPAEVPYWSFGFHQCRFGYNNFIDVADVISNYSAARIPLETMWTDIDYMQKRRVFTLDPDYFPLNRMREIVDYLHKHDQRYIVMVDPAVAYLPEDKTSAYQRGSEMDVWLKRPNGSDLLGVVWPGVTVYPDWFNPKTQSFWTNEIQLFFNASSGVDVDGLWIDMNEPASFCGYPCNDPFEQAAGQGLPPTRNTPMPDKNALILDQRPMMTIKAVTKRAYHGADEDLELPPYRIKNAAGAELGRNTAGTEMVHANGLIEYDTHNIFGSMMSSATRTALEARRPGKRTLVITRSTFAGAGSKVGKWLGDNLSTWWHYRVSIAGMLGFATVYQVPMVGTDICGFLQDTNEHLCARWAQLGSFYPFSRNHNVDGAIPQEYYRWPLVATAARSALDTRYRLLDYMYTAFHAASVDGTPVLQPLWFAYPQDTQTYGVDLQFFYGPSVLVSPVTEENAMSVSAYLPKDMFYDWTTLAPVQGEGKAVTINANYTEIPVHIKGGAILPVREKGAMTTTELRKIDFELIVAPGTDGKASGSLYVDDGESIVQQKTTMVKLEYAKGVLNVDGKFDYPLGVNVAKVKVLGVQKMPTSVTLKYAGKETTMQTTWDEKNKVLVVPVGEKFDRGFTVTIA